MNALTAQPIFRLGAVAVAALGALVLLVVFHSVVAGAVQRAAQRQAEAEAVALRTAAARRAAPPFSFTTHRVSLVRASD